MSKAMKKKRKPGRKSTLTKELLSKIHDGILAGKTDVAIKEELKINNGTWCNWFVDNFEGFRDRVEGWRRDYILGLAKKNLPEFLTMATESEKNNDGEVISFTDPALVRIKADMTKFTLETLGNKEYSKLTKLAGPDGQELGIVILPPKDVKP